MSRADRIGRCQRPTGPYYDYYSIVSFPGKLTRCSRDAGTGETHGEYPDLLLSSPHVVVSVGESLPAATCWISHSSKDRVICISRIMMVELDLKSTGYVAERSTIVRF